MRFWMPLITLLAINELAIFDSTSGNPAAFKALVTEFSSTGPSFLGSGPASAVPKALPAAGYVSDKREVDRG